MFGRGNWSVFGIEPNQSDAFNRSLDSWEQMCYWSQAAANACARVSKVPSVGINPFNRPRLDDDLELPQEELEKLAAFRGLAPEERQHDHDVLLGRVHDIMIAGADYYALDESRQRFGMWFVHNEWKDIGDAASAKEDMAYLTAKRPYRFLDQQGRRAIDDDINGRATDAVVRKQFPVLIDFAAGWVLAETTHKVHLQLLSALLGSLGAKPYAMAWKFNHEGDWIRPLLAALHQQSRFKEAYRKRAEERTRLTPAMMEKNEDQELEKILSSSFSMTELETEEWVGLSAPAEIKLYPTSDRLAASSPTNATLLLAGADALLYSAALVFQERISHITKQGEERTFRREIFRLTVSDAINDLEAGVGLLRGFDQPGFKNAILREIKKSKQVPSIASLWLDWLQGMKSSIATFARTVASLSRETNWETKSGGLVRLYPAETDAGEGITTDTEREFDRIKDRFQTLLRDQWATGTATLAEARP